MSVDGLDSGASFSNVMFNLESIRSWQYIQSRFKNAYTECTEDSIKASQPFAGIVYLCVIDDTEFCAY